MIDGKEENEDVQMGNIGSDLPNHIDRNMWAGEDQDNVEVIISLLWRRAQHNFIILSHHNYGI